LRSSNFKLEVDLCLQKRVTSTKTDSFSASDIEFFDNRDGGKCAAMIFGVYPVHRLRDSFKSYLVENKLPTAITPLAKSHVVAGKARRYDHIFHAPEWRVTSMRYEYDLALTATSDHALVVAELEPF
jgi:hypothetical protein